jgi:hypothetical protein
MKLHFITFGGGNVEYHQAVERICAQARKFSLFKNIFGFTEKDLQDNEEFWKRHGDFIKNNPKGFGYWIWKCFLIKEVMNRKDVEEGDIILFVDAGCELNIKGRKRMIEYIGMTMTHDILAFQMEHIYEKKYTKMDLLEYANVSQEDRDCGQIVGGINFWKKTNKTLYILDEIIHLLTAENYHFIDDSPSIKTNDVTFIDHRHDQSCISVILKKHKVFLLKDETYFEDWSNALLYPILALRNRSGKSCFLGLDKNI